MISSCSCPWGPPSAPLGAAGQAPAQSVPDLNVPETGTGRIVPQHGHPGPAGPASTEEFPAAPERVTRDPGSQVLVATADVGAVLKKSLRGLRRTSRPGPQESCLCSSGEPDLRGAGFSASLRSRMQLARPPVQNPGNSLNTGSGPQAQRRVTKSPKIKPHPPQASRTSRPSLLPAPVHPWLLSLARSWSPPQGLCTGGFCCRRFPAAASSLFPASLSGACRPPG